MNPNDQTRFRPRCRGPAGSIRSAWFRCPTLSRDALRSLPAAVCLAIILANPAIAIAQPLGDNAPTVRPDLPGSDQTGPARINSSGEAVGTGAQDAFGSTVGREQIGIYSITAVRGFDPTVAGNVRISGVYADLPGGISDHVISNLLIRVGLANLGTLLAAPSGIADIELKRPRWNAWAQARMSTDDLGQSGIELDIDTPITGKIGLNAGASGWGLGNDSNGAQPQRTEFGAVITAGGEECTGQAFVSSARSSEGVFPWFYPDVEPGSIRLPRDTFYGHRWNRLRAVDLGAGVVGRCQVSRRIQMTGGIISGRHFVANDSFDLVQQWQGNNGQRFTFLMPPHWTSSLSGEVQANWTVADQGKWLHRLSLGWRGRTTSARSGGEILAVQGPWQLVQGPSPAPDESEFAPQNLDRSSQSGVLLGWRSENANRGIFQFALAPTRYRHGSEISQGQQAGNSEETTALLYSGLAGLHLNKRSTVFIAVSRGIEDSGVAPLSATNRGEVLPAAISHQTEIGVRAGIGKLTANLAAFSISKPYAEEGADGRYTLSGLVRHRGLEGSLVGPVLPGLDLLAGFALIDAKLQTMPGLPTARPVAVPLAIGQIGLDWTLSRYLSIDGKLTVTGAQWLQPDGSLRLPATTVADIGLRFQPRIAGHDYTLRARITNLTNAYQWNSISDGGIAPGSPRRISLSVAREW